MVFRHALLAVKTPAAKAAAAVNMDRDVEGALKKLNLERCATVWLQHTAPVFIEASQKQVDSADAWTTSWGGFPVHTTALLDSNNWPTQQPAETKSWRVELTTAGPIARWPPSGAISSWCRCWPWQAHAMAEANPGGDLQVTPEILITAGELRWRFSRSSGPGGQNVNSTDTRVDLLSDLARSGALPPRLQARALARLADQLVEGCVVITAREHRSQWQNRVAAQRRLLALLQVALRPPAPPRRATRPTRGSVERRLKAKQQRSDLKQQRRRQTHQAAG